MPTVPQYDDFSASPGNGVNARFNAPGIEAPGIKQVGDLGQAGMNAGRDAAAIVSREQDIQDADAALRAVNSLTEEYRPYEDNILSERTGDKVWGVTLGAKTWWDNSVKRYNESLQTERQRRLFSQRAATMRDQSLSTLGGFERRERLSSGTSTTQASTLNLQQDSARAVGTEKEAEVWATNREQILKNTDYIGTLHGWTDAELKLERGKAIEGLHVGIINRMLGNSNATGASEYYKANSAEINDDQLRKSIDAQLKTGVYLQTAQAFAGTVEGKGMEEGPALALARKNFTGEQLRYVETEVQARFADKNRLATQAQSEAYDRGAQILAETGRYSAIPATVLHAMSGLQQLSLQNAAEAKAKGGEVGTDWAMYRDLERVMMQHGNDFLGVPLNEYEGHIGPGPLAVLINAQERMRHDPGAEAAWGRERTRQANELGLSGTENIQIRAQYFNDADQEYTYQRAQLKRDLNDSEMKAIGLKLSTEGRVKGRVWDSKMPYWRYQRELKAGEVEGNFDVSIKDIPPGDRAEIRAALQDAYTKKRDADVAAGKASYQPRPVTDADIVTAYRANRGVR